MANFSSSPSVSFVNSNLWGRMQSILGKPLPYRCKEIEELIITNSYKDVSHVLQSLLENIFGFGAEPGWGLDVITKSHMPMEFDSVIRLLDPDGPLLQLIYNLQTDPYVTFEFPFSSLPTSTKQTIEEGSLPMFYVNKIQYQSYSKPAVILNAFELYMFYFCQALVSSEWQNKPGNWNNLTEVAYPRLLDEYLKFFLPLNKKSLPKFPQSMNTGIRTPLMQQTPVSGRHSPNSGTQTRSRSRLGLFKASLLSPQKQHGQSSPGAEKVEGDLWWSETFIQIIAEFWLNQSPADSERGITPQSLSNFWRRGTQSPDVFHSLFDNFLPSNNHVRLCRLILKHVHYFVNGAEKEILTTPYQNTDVSPLDEFKRSLIPSILQKKVYGFFKNCFTRWPLDSSFKWVLETWLTYIQPWRYAEINKMGPTNQDKDSENVSEIWFPFIRDNFLFYSVLFQEFLQRSKRMHLTSAHNAHMIFRVSKVFNLPNLPHLLRETEKMMYSSLFKQNDDLGGSYLAHELSMVLRVQLTELERPEYTYTNLFSKETEKQDKYDDLGGSYLAHELSMVLRVQLSKLERPEYTYTNLFSKETEKQITELIEGLHTAKLKTEASQQPQKKKEQSGFSSFFNLSSLFDTTSRSGDMSFSEVKNLVSYLDKGVTNLCQVFSLSPPAESSPLSPYTPVRPSSGQSSFYPDQSSYMNQSVISQGPSTPDYHLTSEGPQLTALGRYQLMNGLKKFEIGYQGDPDLQPIRSFENATLVRLLYRFSSFINRQYETEITSLYNRTDLIGKMCKVYFAPPLTPGKQPTSPMSRHSVKTLQTPRFSLRFLANYQTLLYLGLVYLLLSFFMGFGPIGYLLFLIGLVFAYGLCRAFVMVDEIHVR